MNKRFVFNIFLFILLILFLVAWYIGMFVPFSSLCTYIEGKWGILGMFLLAYPLVGSYLCGPFWIIALTMRLLEKRERNKAVIHNSPLPIVSHIPPMPPVKAPREEVYEIYEPISDRFQILDLSNE